MKDVLNALCANDLTKDKTLIEILESLQRLETKVDAIGLPSTPSSCQTPGSAAVSQPRTLPVESPAVSDGTAVGKYTIEGSADPRKAYRHVTAAHKVLLWPSIGKFLIDAGNNAIVDIQQIEEEGTPWFHRLDLAKHPESLAVDTHLSSTPISLPGQNPTLPKRVRFPALDDGTMSRYVLQYFDTYNALYPLLDKEDFWNDHLRHVVQFGFGDSDFSSILCLLVLALGKVADNVHSSGYTQGHPSSSPSDSPDDPPGLEIFNAARKRLGFAFSGCTLENVQILLLSSLYYESCGRYLDFWRFTVTASMTCQAYIQCTSIDWNSHHGDLVRRNYWTCNLIENWYHLDLDLPQTGINDLEAEVALPYLGDQYRNENPDEERFHVQLPFLAMIAIRQLTTSAHAAIFDGEQHCSRGDDVEVDWKNIAITSKAESMDHYGIPPIRVIAELSRQLDNWRAVLPGPLQWKEKEDMVLTGIVETMGGLKPAFFSPVPQLSGSRTNYRYNIDIATAQLRTRYYYARFMIHRPFVYKALHFPHLVNKQDIECIVTCLESALGWPIIMYPPKAKKRLVPFFFAWTQNFMGILLILRMSLENNLLGRISRERISQEKVEETVRLMLDWIRDAKQVDAVAVWCWNIVRPLYPDLLLPGELN
ncbi:MAG: hypothetical protein M1821_001546 [Bathelium mastoideum]|nr:MAG: hypothetical protein M1821_001546 [Bathelium mastoideum]